MGSQTFRMTMYNRLQDAILSYLHVDHPSNLVVRRGQILIALQSLLMLSAFAQTFVFSLATIKTFIASPVLNTIYWLVAVVQLALMWVPIELAKRGKVRLGAYFLLTTSIIGGVKYALGRGYPENDQMFMASMMLMVLIAGALLRARAAVGMAVIASVIDVVLARLFDPGLSSVLLTSMVWITISFGVLLWVVLRSFEAEVEHGEGRIRALEEAAHTSAVVRYREELDALSWNTAHHSLDLVRQPIEEVRASLAEIEARERDQLSEQGRKDLDNLKARLQRLLRDLEHIVEVTPSGMMAVELRLQPTRTDWLLDRFAQDADPTNGDDLTIRVRHEPEAPEMVWLAPVAMRHAMRDCIHYLSAAACGIEMISAAADDCWTLRLNADTPRSNGEPPAAALHRARTRIRAMNGSVTVEGSAEQPSAVVIAIPLRRPD